MTSKQAKRIFKKLIMDKSLMNNMVMMTKIMWKLNDKERIALMDYHRIIEDNARWDMLTRCFDKLILVMHEEEFKQFQKEIRKEYGFWKVKKQK